MGATPGQISQELQGGIEIQAKWQPVNWINIVAIISITGTRSRILLPV